ncbi:MAG: putative viral replication protein [Cressdnaviricota sp.]|nr:MAG: putative viral replication protein [Cressdnaviricota sp.]
MTQSTISSPAQSNGTQKTKWVFTVNDNAQVWSDGLMELIYNNESEHVRYICGQLEIAPGTGNLHFQGYLQLKRTRTLSWVKAHIHNTAHWEYQKAPNNDQARDYCRKEDTRAPNASFVEFGDYCEKKGKRTDLVPFKDAIKGGMRQRELADEFTNQYIRYYHSADRLASLYVPERPTVSVKLYYGHPGTGKTRLAMENPDHYVIPIGKGLWLDGYDKQDTLILDDFSGSLSSTGLTDTLRLLDRYPLRVPVKGSFTWITASTVIVTTNIHPYRWYKWTNRENQYEALYRRFTEVWYFPRGSPPEEHDRIEFFYDDDMIWPPKEQLARPLPVCDKPFDYPEYDNTRAHITGNNE